MRPSFQFLSRGKISRGNRLTPVHLCRSTFVPTLDNATILFSRHFLPLKTEQKRQKITEKATLYPCFVVIFTFFRLFFCICKTCGKLQNLLCLFGFDFGSFFCNNGGRSTTTAPTQQIPNRVALEYLALSYLLVRGRQRPQGNFNGGEKRKNRGRTEVNQN